MRKKRTPPVKPAPDSAMPKPPVEWLAQILEWLRWLWQWLGWRAAIGIGPIVVGLVVWWNWKDIRDRPGIQTVVDRFNQEPLPQAAPGRFSIAITHLDGDAGQVIEKLVYQSLSEIAGGPIQVFRFDRLIPTEGSDSSRLNDQGHSQARDLLNVSHAQAVIWGTVLRSGQTAVPKLYWTVNKTLEGIREVGRYPITATDLDLPPIFWEDLQNVLALLTLSEAIQYEDEGGHYLADRLKSFIDRVQDLIQRVKSKRAWDSDQQAKLQFILANALATFGDQAGDNAALTQAVAAYRTALEEWTRERAPLQWAWTQNNLGATLLALGQREAGTARLEEAVAAFRAALQEFTWEQMPSGWAMTQSNLGAAFLILGQREAGSARLEEAVAACHTALEKVTREQMPLRWAMIQVNLGAAFLILGQREADSARLEEAVAALRTALQELTYERAPLYWASAQSNLGAALLVLGQRGAGSARLEEAVAALRAALQASTRERTPLKWGEIQTNLGAALLMLGQAAKTALSTLQGVSEPVMAQWSAMTQEAKAAEAQLRRAISWFSWRWIAIIGVLGVGIMAGIVLAVKTMLWWEEFQIRSLLRERAELTEEVSRLEATAEQWSKKAGRATLSTCNGRPCVQVNEKAGRWGDEPSRPFFIIKGY